MKTAKIIFLCLVFFLALAPAFTQSFPLTVKDSLGRSVTLKANPGRIISLSPSNTEILFALGLGDRVVGVTSYCNYPPEALKKEKIGAFSASTISIEKILTLKPDLILAVGSMHKLLIDNLEKYRLTVYSLEVESMAELFKEIEKLGRICGVTDRAGEITRVMQGRLDYVREKVSSVPESRRLRVFWEIYDDPIMTAGKSSFQNELIEIAGGKNIFSDINDPWPVVNQEEVIRRNPQVIMGSDDHGDKLTADQIKRRPGWANLEAVKNNRIHLISGDEVGRTGPRVVNAVEAMARALYPEVF